MTFSPKNDAFMMPFHRRHRPQEHRFRAGIRIKYMTGSGNFQASAQSFCDLSRRPCSATRSSHRSTDIGATPTCPSPVLPGTDSPPQKQSGLRSPLSAKILPGRTCDVFPDNFLLTMRHNCSSYVAALRLYNGKRMNAAVGSRACCD